MKKPLLSSGKIVADYRPLIEYWRLAKKKDPSLAEKIIVKNNDIELIRSLSVEKRDINYIINVLRDKVIERIDAGLAKESIKNVYNLEVSEEDARLMIAKILVGWYVEVADSLNVVKIKNNTTSSSNL